MNEERGAALRLLYQLKLAISKYNERDPNELKTSTNLRPHLLDKKLQETNHLQQTLSLDKGMRTMNRATKLQIVEKNLLKFEHTKRL